MLDNAVAGGVAVGETPRECLAREAEEEAGLDARLVRDKARALGVLTWWHAGTPVNAGVGVGVDSTAAGARVEQGLEQCLADATHLTSCAQVVFELEVPPEVIPRAMPGEVEEFHLWDVEQVRDAICKGEFKPASAMAFMEFLGQRGLLGEDEEGWRRVRARMRRDLPFPSQMLLLEDLMRG